MKLTKQRISAIALAVAMGLGLAGCGSDEADMSAADPSASASQASTADPSAKSSATASAVGSSKSSAEPTGKASPAATESGVAAPEGSKQPASPRPAVTTPVAAPGGGSVKERASAKAVPSAKPVSIDQTSEVAPKTTVAITAVKAIEAKATLPGDVSGPAVQFTVTVNNATDKPVPTDNVVVNVTGSDKAPGVMLMGAPTKAFSGEVKAGSKASAVYAFRVAPDQRKPVVIEVSVDPSLPVASFNGDVA